MLQIRERPVRSGHGPTLKQRRRPRRNLPRWWWSAAGVSTMSSASNDEVVAPWADLLPELCDHVLDHLDAVSAIRFPAASTAWAAASRMTPRLRSGTPTLLTSGLDPDGYDVEYDVEAGTFGLHDVAGGKSFYGEAQWLKNRTWIGGKDDWLVTTDLRCSVELLNPITGDRVPLPSFTTIRRLEVADYYELHVAVNNRLHLFQQVKLCQTPAHPNGHLAVALFSSGPLGLLAFTAHGDEGWTPLMNPAEVHYLKYTDATVHDGKVVAVAESGDIYSWDMMDGTTTEPTLLPRPEIHHVSYDLRRGFYLAASSGGQLQVVCMYGHGDVKDKRRRRIVFKDQWSFFARHVSLHELDADTGAWRRLRDLGGDRALFVGGNYPFYATVPPGGSDNLQADCVYVADLLGCDAAFFDLKLGDDHMYDFECRLSYPAMGDSLQMPMWFRPTAYPIAQVPVEERQTI
ncbi:hypothetical protein GQ55_7G310700 [Panicum hallii var. hallii]|uniref:KIB1-4 beta-propeller domain-containing protein n=1 Tax=Panicum hallii var. hallii TaxID=1504633 RepID=A0A2T7D107_9POAL|nr:hypothetical protein GQ55_7G310700 [Panicum hallii var. hallii]